MSYCGCGMTLGMDGKCPSCGGKGMGEQMPSYSGRDYAGPSGNYDPKYTPRDPSVREGPMSGRKGGGASMIQRAKNASGAFADKYFPKKK